MKRYLLWTAILLAGCETAPITSASKDSVSVNYTDVTSSRSEALQNAIKACRSFGRSSAVFQYESPGPGSLVGGKTASFACVD